MKKIVVFCYIFFHFLLKVSLQTSDKKQFLEKNLSKEYIENTKYLSIIDKTDTTHKTDIISNLDDSKEYKYEEKKVLLNVDDKKINDSENDNPLPVSQESHDRDLVSPINNVTVTAVFDDNLKIIQLNISWDKPSDSCSPLDYNFKIRSQHNSLESNMHDGNITNVLLPYYLHSTQIEPGCTYSVEIIAHCMGERHVSRSNYTVPECVGQKCKCINLKPKIISFKANQITSDSLNISWQIDNDSLFRRINNLTQISFNYRLSHDGEHLKNDIPFNAWLEDINKLTNKSSIIVPTNHFREGFAYDILGIFGNNFSCSSYVYVYNFTIFKLEMVRQKNDIKMSWIKIPFVMLIVSTTIASVAFCTKRNYLSVFKKLFHDTSYQTSLNNPRQIVLDTTNPLYQEQPLIAKENTPGLITDHYEFPRSNLKLIKFINGGEFGEVHLGKALNILGKPGWTYVAVKKAKDNYVKSEVCDDFLEEICILKKVSNHPHIVSLLGCCTREHPFLILMEYVPCGSLKEYLMELREKWSELKKRRRTESDSVFNEGSECSYICPESPGSGIITGRTFFQMPSSTDTEYTNLSSEGPNSASPTTPSGLYSMEYLLDNKELKKFSLQIAKGMAYLEQLGITHRDLAARNILMDEFKTLKITDFGLSRYGTYVVANKMKLPVRWMAIESIRDLVFNNKTDVWSFAVVLWEIGTLGGLPHKEVPVELLHSHIIAGRTLTRPPICTDELYSLMQRCWATNPDDRPTFAEIVEIQSRKDTEAYIDFSLLNPTYMFPPTD